jgi:hypothetical protein
MRDRTNLITDFGSREKRSRHLEQQQNLTPKSILNIWYECRGLHLLGAPIHVFQD